MMSCSKCGGSGTFPVRPASDGSGIGLTPEESCPNCINEKYNKPCPYNPKVMCVQMPGEEGDDSYCDDGCPNRGGA